MLSYVPQTSGHDVEGAVLRAQERVERRIDTVGRPWHFAAGLDPLPSLPFSGRRGGDDVAQAVRIEHAQQGGDVRRIAGQADFTSCGRIAFCGSTFGRSDTTASSGRIRVSAATQRGQNCVPDFAFTSASASSTERAAR